MKKGIYASIIALSLVLTASAYSAQGMYVSGNVGLTLVDDIDLTDDDNLLPGADIEMEFDSGWNVAGAIGYRMDNIRFEAEIGYQENDVDNVDFRGRDVEFSGDANVLSLLANGYYDFVNSSAWTPFVTAGLGMAQVEISDLNFAGSGLRSASEDDSVFAWQIGAGVSYAISDMLDLEMKYRYLMVSDLEFEEGFEVDGPNSHIFSLGMRYNF
jgi:opacity protein-like surface antigen